MNFLAGVGAVVLGAILLLLVGALIVGIAYSAEGRE